MALIFFRQRGDFAVTDNLPVSATENELTASEIAQGKHTLAFNTSFFDDDIGDHGGLILIGSKHPL